MSTMLKFSFLALVFLFSEGIQIVKTTSLFVSYHGHDLDNCGNWSMPCRSVRQAVKISNDGDNIYIDYGQGKPYMECDNMTYSTCSIELTKSVSFYGLNGKAEVQCKKICQLFKMTSSTSTMIRVKFVNLIISNSNVVVKLVKARMELVFHNMVIKDNLYAIYSKYSKVCIIKIFNSSFEHNTDWGIRLKCLDLTAQIFSSTFKMTPVLFQNFGDKPTLWQKTDILIRNTIFNGENIQKCCDMFRIYPYAIILNVTITDSEFKNHVAICSSKNKFSTLHIYDEQTRGRNKTFIFLRNLLIENNYNTWAVLSLTVGYVEYNKIEVDIRDSIFRNNSAALSISMPVLATKYYKTLPTISVDNNTFIGNFYTLEKPNGAAAIYFSSCKSRVSTCRFTDNKAGPNVYTAVVRITDTATITFFDCYFENRQTSVPSNQLFASGNKPLHFTGQNIFNFLALKESQSVFIRIPTAMSSGAIIKKNFKLLCPQGYKLNLQRQCDVIKTGYMCYYINVQCEQCPTKTYALQRGKLVFNKSNDIQCHQCPKGGDCDDGLVTAKSNFWGYKTKKKVSFIQCPPGYCCESENCATYDTCHGNRSGTLCGQCPEGMSESLFSTQCISNTECSINYFFILGTIGMLVLYLVVFLYHIEIVEFLRTSLFSKSFLLSIKMRNEQRNNFNISSNTSSGNGIIKIFFYYYQVCRLLRSSVSSFKKYQFINNFENVVSSIMNMVLVNVPSFNCPLKNLRAVPKAVVLHSAGFCLLGLLCLLYLVSRLFLFFRRIKGGSDRRTALENVTSRTSVQENITTKPTLSQRIASAFTYTSLLMYASSAQLCLSLLHCVPVGDRQVLFLDGSIKCYQTFQYFLLAYMISSILPFCLVPVLGSYLLKLGRIGVKQFCAGCIFPLPFCCFWMYLLLNDCRWRNQGTYKTMKQRNNLVTNEEISNEGLSGSSEGITFTTERNKKRSTRAILRVLLGPFRDHQAFMCFPSSHIPWEGFLIFRRLVLIIVLTFVYDIQLRLFLALITCLAILLFHMFVNPFQRKCDNVLESFSLSSHIVLCGLTLIKALYYGEDYASLSSSLPVLNVIENIFIVAPLSIIIIVVTLCIIIKLAFGLLFCVLFLIGKIRRLIMKLF